MRRDYMTFETPPPYRQQQLRRHHSLPEMSVIHYNHIYVHLKGALQSRFVRIRRRGRLFAVLSPQDTVWI